MKQLYKNKLFIKYALYYLLTLTITLVTLVCVCIFTIDISRNYAIGACKTNLEKGRIVIDTRLRELEEGIKKLADNRNIRGFSQTITPLQDRDYDKIRDVTLELVKTNIQNSLVSNLYIFFDSSEVIISKEISSTHASFVYDHYLKYDGLSYNQWREEILKKQFSSIFWPSRNISLNNTRNNYVTYISSLPYKYYFNQKGAIICLIDESALLFAIVDDNVKSGGYTYICDRDNEIILLKNYSGVDPYIMPGNDKGFQSEYISHTVDGKKYVFINSFSDYNDWVYISAIPVTVLTNQTNNLRNIFIVITISILFFELIVIIYLSKKQMLPIVNIVSSLKPYSDNAENNNYFQYINSSIDAIKSANYTLSPSFAVNFSNSLITL